MPDDEKMVTIPMREYVSLIKDQEKLKALERMGVDNWQGYDDAMGLIDDEDDEE